MGRKRIYVILSRYYVCISKHHIYFLDKPGGLIVKPTKDWVVCGFDTKPTEKSFSAEVLRCFKGKYKKNKYKFIYVAEFKKPYISIDVENNKVKYKKKYVKKL